jgi:nucleotide-binding universal stress UspA family protein
VRKAYSEKSAAKGRGRPFRVDKILIPIDFSPFSECALELGASLARDLGAKVSLVHALNLPGYPLNDRQTATPAALLITEMRKMARKKIQEMAARARLSGTAEVVEGSPTMAICGYAAAADVDLIIISTHGRSGLKHALLGSVAERVVRHADCPVLVLPARWATKTPQPK